MNCLFHAMKAIRVHPYDEMRCPVLDGVQLHVHFALFDS